MTRHQSQQKTFTLDDAVEIARRAHQGQRDKAGLPYIDHPLRVMNNVDGDEARMTAVLHDVLEDTPVTADDLRAVHCPPTVVAAVIALSRSRDEPLAQYLRKVAADPLALVVKRADIADNSDPDRLAKLDLPVRTRLQTKYAQSLELLRQYEPQQLT